MSAFNVTLEAALYGSEEDSCNSDGGSINKSKAEVITVDSCVQPDNKQEDLVNNKYTQTFDITDQSNSVPMTGAYEARNLLATPELVQTTDHQEQILEAELLIPDADYETEKARDTKFEELFEQNFKKFYQKALGLPESTDSSQIELTTYELENYEKNDMIIFNHENFLDERKRGGTALDVAALEGTFKQFRFVVTTHNDLTEKDLFREIRKFSRKDFRESGCICVAILTHGQDHGYLEAFDTRYCERDVIACFDGRLNPSLVGKPIIFLIQACRGRHPASVVEAQSKGSPLPVQTVELDAGYNIERRRRPMDSDIIMFHSCFFGRASIRWVSHGKRRRVVEEGTWFIQSICEQIRLHGDTDHLEKLCRRVRSIVAHMEYEGAKQMPVVTTTLLKKLYLKKTRFSSDLDDIWRNAKELFDSLETRQCVLGISCLKVREPRNELSELRQKRQKHTFKTFGK